MADEKRIELPHNVIIEGRQKMTVSGVLDIDSFDEETVIAVTDMGEMAIRGTELHINKLSIDMGEMTIEGNIISLTYSESQQKSGGFFSKVFR